MPTSGQLPSLQSYTQLLLFFPGLQYTSNDNVQTSDIDTPSSSATGNENSSAPKTESEEKSLVVWRNEVLETLRIASRKVVTNFPWLGGKIGNTGLRYVMFSSLFHSWVMGLFWEYWD